MDRERPDDVHRLADVELRDDDLLRHLVGEEGSERDRDERDPLERTGGERPLGHGDRDTTVGRRADANVDQSRRRIGQTRPSRRLHSMHFVAYGIASSRSSAIGFPHRTHVPKLPSSILLSASSMAARTWPEFSSSE
jgi:hypothetical protein